MQCACAILSTVACLVLPNFSTLSHTRQDFRQKKKLLNIKCVFWFSLQLLSETFLILRRTEREIWWKKNPGLYVKYSLLLLDYNETWIFSTDFRNIRKYQMSWKSIQWESSCSLRTDGRDEANSRFSHFCKRALKPLFYSTFHTYLIIHVLPDDVS
jgi:hypothetical protein